MPLPAPRKSNSSRQSSLKTRKILISFKHRSSVFTPVVFYLLTPEPGCSLTARFPSEYFYTSSPHVWPIACLLERNSLFRFSRYRTTRVRDVPWFPPDQWRQTNLPPCWTTLGIDVGNSHSLGLCLFQNFFTSSCPERLTIMTRFDELAQIRTPRS